MTVLVFVLIVAAAAGARWLWHLKWHPLGNCRWCDGTGRNRGSIRTRYGLCSHCSGGRRPRAGAGLLHRELRKGERK